MKKETIENILNFLKEQEGKEIPQKWVDSIKKLELIKELENYPDGIQYRHEGDLYLTNSKITKLPNDLYVGGSLRLYGCKQITELPDKLYVRGNLNLSYSNITKLPNDLYVGLDFDLDDSNIIELPKELEVRGDLHLNYSSIKKLPDGLHVKGHLFLVGTSIEEIPNNLYVGKFLFLWNTPLAEKYTSDEVYEMINKNGGNIRGKIYTT
jgi:hypothetical protein